MSLLSLCFLSRVIYCNPPTSPHPIQVPDGEFLCPKCKTEEAAAPPLTPSKKGKGGAIPGESGGGGGGGSRTGVEEGTGPSVAGEHGRPAPGASAGGGGAAAAAGGGGSGGAKGGQEKNTGMGVGVAGISMLATDGSMVDLTQMAM